MIKLQCKYCLSYFDNDHWCQKIDALITLGQLQGKAPVELNPSFVEQQNELDSAIEELEKNLGADVPPNEHTAPEIDLNIGGDVTHIDSEKTPETSPQSVTNESQTESDADFLNEIFKPKES